MAIYLTTHVHNEEHGLKFSCVNGRGIRETYDLKDVAKKGLPLEQSAFRRVVTSFSEWSPADFREYAAAFAMDVPDDSAHDVWTFQGQKTRLVIPALALIRAMFMPTHKALPFLFRPQSLAEVCSFNASATRGMVDVRIYRVKRRREAESLQDSYSWMYCFPSARRMWNSVYLRSSDGRLSIELPEAEVRGTFYGRAHANNFYVTKFVPLHLVAEEAPDEFASDHSREISYYPLDSVYRNGHGINSGPGATIPFRNGQTSLSDEEWRVIEPLVVRGGNRRVYVDNLRMVIDALLARKLAPASWAKIAESYPVNWRRCAIWNTRWRHTGQWSLIVEMLRKARGADEESEDI